MYVYLHSLLFFATGPNVLLLDTNVRFLSLFNAYMKIHIFTELIVSLVLQVWASVAVMGGDKFPTHLTFVSISREKRKKNKNKTQMMVYDTLHKKLRIDQDEPVTNRGSMLVFKS